MRPARVAIIIGHEKKAQGALLQGGQKKIITEYEYNLKVAAAMKELSKHYNCEVATFLRDNIGRQAVKKQAVEWGPDVILELHFNSSDKRDVAGAEILCNKYYSDLPLPKMILGECVRIFGGKNRGIKIPGPDDNGFMNVKCILPLFLLEPFFGSNEVQAQTALINVVEYAQSLLSCVEEIYANNPAQRVN